MDLATETERPLAAGDVVTVTVSRSTLRLLVLGADGFREMWNTAVESANPGLVDLIAPYLDQLTDAGLVSVSDGRTTEAFDLACTLGGIALGTDAGGGEYQTDDGEGVDGLAGADNDDFSDDVDAAERAFVPSVDPDWPGDPVVSILDCIPDASDRLPAAASFGGD